MKKNIVVINKDNQVIKNYLDARSELLKVFREKRDPKEYDWDFMENEFDTDSFVKKLDEILSKEKLSKRASQYLIGFDPICFKVEHDWVFSRYNGRYYEIESFETKAERDVFIKKFKKEVLRDFDEIMEEGKDFYTTELKQIEGNLEENLDLLEEKNGEGYDIFIKVSSVFSENIVVGFIE